MHTEFCLLLHRSQRQLPFSDKTMQESRVSMHDMKNEYTNPSYSSNKIMNKSKIMQDSYCKNSFFGVSYYITHFT